MKINTRVIYVDNKYGEGWRIKRTPSFYPTTARDLVHDILEHSRNDKGTWAEEVSAYGAIIAWRLDLSDNFGGRATSIDEKIIRLAKEFVDSNLDQIIAKYDQEYFLKLPKCKPKFKSDYCTRVADAAIDYWLESVDTPYSNDFSKTVHKWIFSYLENGYSQAMKVISTTLHDPADIWSTCREMVEIHLMKGNFYEGAEASIQIDIDACICNIIPIRFM
jgi:hypothetical protein